MVVMRAGRPPGAHLAGGVVYITYTYLVFTGEYEVGEEEEEMEKEETEKEEEENEEEEDSSKEEEEEEEEKEEEEMVLKIPAQDYKTSPSRYGGPGLASAAAAAFSAADADGACTVGAAEPSRARHPNPCCSHQGLGFL